MSYRPNAPVQINSTDVLYGGVKLLGGAYANASLLNGQEAPIYTAIAIKKSLNFKRHYSLFDVMTLSRLTLVGEVVAIWSYWCSGKH